MLANRTAPLSIQFLRIKLHLHPLSVPFDRYPQGFRVLISEQATDRRWFQLGCEFTVQDYENVLGPSPAARAEPRSSMASTRIFPSRNE